MSLPEDGSAAPRSMEDDLRLAIRKGELTVHWQPYFNIRTGKVAGHEALVRWDRLGYGPLPPSVFIPVAEESDLIGALDACVLKMACKAAVNWDSELKVSVNISPYWLTRGDLVQLVEETLAGTGFPARRLVLELTERTLVDHTAAARERMLSLNRIGVRLALDDFGIGYSSLSYLQQFAFDYVKLDRSFISGLGSDRRAEALAEAIMNLGRALEMQACAEGVETEAHLKFLTEAGCDFVQGFLLGRPNPIPQMHDIATALSGRRRTGTASAPEASKGLHSF